MLDPEHSYLRPKGEQKKGGKYCGHILTTNGKLMHNK